MSEDSISSDSDHQILQDRPIELEQSSFEKKFKLSNTFTSNDIREFNGSKVSRGEKLTTVEEPPPASGGLETPHQPPSEPTLDIKQSNGDDIAAKSISDSCSTKSNSDSLERANTKNNDFPTKNVSENEAKDEGATGGLSGVVVKHYNSIKEVGLEGRKESRIFYLRNLNNWIKSQLINEFTNRRVKSRTTLSASSGQMESDVSSRKMERNFQVLDIGCGKGGDLLKWKKYPFIDHVVLCDIAETSIEQAKDRYQSLRDRLNRHESMFTAEYHVADCTKCRLSDLFLSTNFISNDVEKDTNQSVIERGENKKKVMPSPLFDIVSCQFAFHYSFESIEQADRMMLNISECMKVGSYFIGTLPDANQVVKRLSTKRVRKRKRLREDSNEEEEIIEYGNDVYKISAASNLIDQQNEIPLFGSQYMFHLEGVVDCPEFLVHFPTLEAIAAKHSLTVVHKQPFSSYFHSLCSPNSNDVSLANSSKKLLFRMSALETFPPLWRGNRQNSIKQNGRLVGESKYDYNYSLVKENLKEYTSHNPESRVGTLSKEEWEAFSLYMVFAFQKF